MRIHRLALPVAALLLALTLPGQLPLGWARKDRMTARAAVGMAEDTGRGRLVMFGGIYTPQTWEWDGLAWTLRAPAMSPPVLGGCAMAYDPQRGRTLLFGGDSGILSPRDDTWEWDGTTWTQQSPAAKPGPRRHHGMAYDAARRRIVLFGGYNDVTGRVLNDTWEWDGTTWTQATPAVASPRIATLASTQPPADRALQRDLDRGDLDLGWHDLDAAEPSVEPAGSGRARPRL